MILEIDPKFSRLGAEWQKKRVNILKKEGELHPCSTVERQKIIQIFTFFGLNFWENRQNSRNIRGAKDINDPHFWG